MGVLETYTLALEHDGAKTIELRSRALQIAKMARAQAAIVDAMPRDIALRALGELHREGARYQLQVPWRSQLLDNIGGDPRDREWAIAEADAYPVGPPDPQAFLKSYIFRALVRSKTPIERRWEHLYPNVVGASLELLIECAGGLAEDRRAPVLAEHFSSMQAAAQIVAAFPTAEMVTTLLTCVGMETPYGAGLLTAMKRLGGDNEIVRGAVAAFVADLPAPVALTVTSIVRPNHAHELSAIAKEQLRVAGRAYDQQDLDASARLEQSNEETSFHGVFEMRTVAESDGAAAYDILIVTSDAGSIFEAGTTNEIGALSQGGAVVLEKENEPLRAALQGAVRAKEAAKPDKPAKPAKKKPTRVKK